MLTRTVLVLVVGSTLANAASQLAPFFQALAKDPSFVSDRVDPNTQVPSEEIPVIAEVINSGNPHLMRLAVLGATAILQVHRNDDRPNFHVLKGESFADVKQEFQALVPIVTAHFNDPMPITLWNGVDEGPEVPWKTNVVQFMDVLGATPSPEMIAWMLKILQYPTHDSGRIEEGMKYVKEHDPTLRREDQDAMLDTSKRIELQEARDVITVLANLHPMPTEVFSALENRMDDVEPYGAQDVIYHLTQNGSLNDAQRLDLADRLVAKSLDKTISSDVRATAIHGLGLMNVPTATKAKLKGLDRDSDEKIAGAAIDIGINNLFIRELFNK